MVETVDEWTIRRLSNMLEKDFMLEDKMEAKFKRKTDKFSQRTREKQGCKGLKTMRETTLRI